MRVDIDAFNALDAGSARAALEACCVSQRWISGVLESRPFATTEALSSRADEVWAAMEEADILEAFEGHPKIGDVNSLKAKYAHTGGLAAHEQSSVAEASEGVIERLAAGNSAYEAKFGFIFIVCATGKSALEMCELLEARLGNERSQELLIAKEEQRKIMQLRLEKQP